MLKEKCLSCDIKSAAVGFLDELQLKLLGENCAEAVFKKGETIIKQDSLSSNIIYLKEGLVKTSMEWNQKHQILNIIKDPLISVFLQPWGIRSTNTQLLPFLKPGPALLISGLLKC